MIAFLVLLAQLKSLKESGKSNAIYNSINPRLFHYTRTILFFYHSLVCCHSTYIFLHSLVTKLQLNIEHLCSFYVLLLQKLGCIVIITSKCSIFSSLFIAICRKNLCNKRKNRICLRCLIGFSIIGLQKAEKSQGLIEIFCFLTRKQKSTAGIKVFMNGKTT